MLLAQVEGFVAVAREGNLRRAAEPCNQPAGPDRAHPGARGGAGRGLFRRTYGHGAHPCGSGLPAVCGTGARVVPQRCRAGARARAGCDRRAGVGAAPAVCAYVLPESWRVTRSVTRTCGCWCGPTTRRSSSLWWLAARSSSRSSESSATRGSASGRCSRTSWSWWRGRTTRSRSRARSTFDDPPRAAHPVRPNVELLRPDPRPVPFAGVVPRGVMELDNIEAAKRMVERGLGVALLPGTAVADALSGGSLREMRSRRGDDPPADGARRTARLAPRVAVPGDAVGPAGPDPGADPAGAADRRRRLSRPDELARLNHRRGQPRAGSNPHRRHHQLANPGSG